MVRTHLVVSVLMLLSWNIEARSISGKVVSVADGDTITVLDSSKTRHRIRLAQIDAPEKKQDFGRRSKQSLSDLVAGRLVTIDIETTDQYRRLVGTVIADGRDVNLEQVRRGMAWVYTRYAHDPAYYAAESTAKASGIGLWSQPHPVSPWEFRHRRKSGGSASVNKQTSDNTFSCDRKRYCKEMTSCKEAMIYLRQCGIVRLDRDQDGVPCESLCQREYK